MGGGERQGRRVKAAPNKQKTKVGASSVKAKCDTSVQSLVRVGRSTNLGRVGACLTGHVGDDVEVVGGVDDRFVDDTASRASCGSGWPRREKMPKVASTPSTRSLAVARNACNTSKANSLSLSQSLTRSASKLRQSYTKSFEKPRKGTRVFIPPVRKLTLKGESRFGKRKPDSQS